MAMLLSVLNLLLEQTKAEKEFTIIGVSIFAVIVFMLLLDSVVKNKLVPKNKNVKLFIIFLFIASLIAIILLTIYYI